MKYLLFCFLLIAVGCSGKPGTEQIETLQVAEYEANSKNLEILSQISRAVEELGFHAEHIKVLEQARNIVEKRKRFGFALLAERDRKPVNKENLNKYLAEVDLLLSKMPGRSREGGTPNENQLIAYTSRIEKLLEEEHPLNAHFVLLNVLYLEGELLYELAQWLGHH